MNAETTANAGSAVRAAGSAAAVPAVSKAQRLASYQSADFPVPTGREEEWRFTPLERLLGLHTDQASADGQLSVEVQAPASVRVETVGRDDRRVGAVAAPTDRVAALAFERFEKATVVTVAAESRPEQPVLVRVHGQGGTAYGHLLVDVERFAEATVVLDYTGSARYAENVEFAVADGARLTVVTVQDWDRDAVHLTHHQARLARDARFTSVLATFGGDLVRSFPQVAFDAPGGDAELIGIYFADRGQHLEQRLLVDHSVEHCRSRVTYKGALQGEGAHAVWIGDVLIRAAAEGTDTYELNRNLVLTDGARADSVPNLEIETGEIAGAGHASATGRFDDEQLFYLQSRGIPELQARRLVVRGFFADLISRIELPEIQERLLARVEERLEAAVGE